MTTYGSSCNTPRTCHARHPTRTKNCFFFLLESSATQTLRSNKCATAQRYNRSVSSQFLEAEISAINRESIINCSLQALALTINRKRKPSHNVQSLCFPLQRFKTMFRPGKETRARTVCLHHTRKKKTSKKLGTPSYRSHRHTARNSLSAAAKKELV